VSGIRDARGAARASDAPRVRSDAEARLGRALGADTLLHGHLDGDYGRLVTVRINGHFAVGQDHVAVTATGAVHQFDPKSNDRLSKILL
jgi:hypothetical protein